MINRFTVGRIALGCLMIVQGIVLMQGGYKEQMHALKDLRSHLNKNHEDYAVIPGLPFLARYMAGFTDQSLQMTLYLQAVALLLSGALVIANIRVGGLLMTGAMLSLAITRDNPKLTASETGWRYNIHATLKDLAVAGMGLLLFMRRLKVKHRKGGEYR